MQQISYYSWASKCVFVANQNYNKLFIYSLTFGHCFFVSIKLQQGFYELFYGCLFLQACVKVCRILYKIGVQSPHNLLDLQHLDVFVFALPTCEICHTCEVSFLNATIHKPLDLQHLDVFVFAQPTCEICYTYEVRFFIATMCVVRWPNLE
jgi:hypothetical protein